MISIKPIKKSDYNKILVIEKNLFKNPMTQIELNNFFSQNAFRIWKIEQDRVLGYISFYQVKDEIEIIRIGIIKSYQRISFGSLLIDKIKKLDVKKIFLEVSVQNEEAINFYIKNGFQKIGIRKGYYADNKSYRIDALRMCVKL
ncbi:GNAT family N-acetyltransferase [Candidatus Levibacter sp. Uisw_134_01]|uniref:GNAT family N-acetyltransferase n=1 Tax=Candidatus Levibacter sp. Uisw_134_01 TaxID=3230999 RepID=UPI003D4879D6